MYPFIRYASTIAQAALKAKKGDTLTLKETSEIQFRCRLSDIDNFLEMNNGRVFTLYDLGRMDFAVRTGLGKQLLKQRWGLVIAGSTIQYRLWSRLYARWQMSKACP